MREHIKSSLSAYIRWMRSLMLEECWEHNEHHGRHGSVTEESLERHRNITRASQEHRQSVTGESQELHCSVTGASLQCQYSLRRKCGGTGKWTVKCVVGNIIRQTKSPRRSSARQRNFEDYIHDSDLVLLQNNLIEKTDHSLRMFIWYETQCRRLQ